MAGLEFRVSAVGTWLQELDPYAGTDSSALQGRGGRGGGGGFRV